ncbi:MAG: hypothetical protein HC835_18065 [Oscillatoriales cyanobacterium RM2_1_1]|nr:hypothetical protein [Oscillatoriales cyanobacterium RM2_1_1]
MGWGCPSQSESCKGWRSLKVGDIISTETGSQARLQLDSSIGAVELAEKTTLEIKALSGEAGTSLDQKTVLVITQGQILCAVGRFVSAPFWSQTLPQNQRQQSIQESHFRVETPAAVIGVKGTTFGVSVAPDGQTAVQTIEGSVGVLAAGQEVIVEKGQFVVVQPQMKPTAPEQIPTLSELEGISAVRLTPKTVRLQGQISPADLLYVEDQGVETDAAGEFVYIGQLPASRRLKVTLRGPSVRERHYIITVP